MKNIIVKNVALLIVLAMLLTGCTSAPQEPSAPPARDSAAPTQKAVEPIAAPEEDTIEAELSGEIMISDSTSVEYLVTVLADLFMEKHEKVSIAVQGNGSSAGIKAVADGTAQLGMSFRNLKDEEKNGLTPTTICMDGTSLSMLSSSLRKILHLRIIKRLFLSMQHFVSKINM